MKPPRPAPFSFRVLYHRVATGAVFIATTGMFFMLPGCARDPLEEAAWQASRMGTAVGDRNPGDNSRGLEAGSKIVERYYWVAKYQATLEQRQVAEATAKKIVRKMAKKTGGRKAPRYIAVKTRSDSRAKTTTSVMLFDTVSEEIVGNDVYDLSSAPSTGTTVKFEVSSAVYVGTEG